MGRGVEDWKGEMTFDSMRWGHIKNTKWGSITWQGSGGNISHTVNKVTKPKYLLISSFIINGLELHNNLVTQTIPSKA